MAQHEDEAVVTFNVGGVLYQVRRSLLEKFPNIMLARSAAKNIGTTVTRIAKSPFLLIKMDNDFGIVWNICAMEMYNFR
jgi:hypothetical protein